MRVRSTQLVFLVLLLCSVQMRGECALQLATTAVSAGPRTSALRQIAHQQHGSSFAASALKHNARVPSEKAAGQPPALSVSGPVRAAMAVNSFTGRLRA